MSRFRLFYGHSSTRPATHYAPSRHWGISYCDQYRVHTASQHGHTWRTAQLPRSLQTSILPSTTPCSKQHARHKHDTHVQSAFESLMHSSKLDHVQNHNTRHPWSSLHHSSLPMTRGFSTSLDRRGAAAVAYNLSRDELEGLVDGYPNSPDTPTPKPPINFDTNMKCRGMSNSTNVDAEIKNSVARLVRVLKHSDVPLKYVMEMYYELPPPAAQYLSANVLRKLRNRLADVSDQDEDARARYLSVVTDCLAASKSVPLSAWTTAISFAGQSTKPISTSEIDSALTLWKQMENRPDVQANEVTFNTLFSVAAKAGKFVLADMILRIMQSRGLPMSRYFRISLIYYHGLRQDGRGVRQAYKDLVEAGEVVDSAVISCVVEALLKAGEPTAAEHTFEHAKKLHAEKSGISSEELRPVKPAARSRYMGLVPGSKTSKDNSRTTQETANASSAWSTADKKTPSLAPTIRTYRALIYYHAITAGNITKVTSLVSELESIDPTLHGIIFHHVFKGFACHAGLLYSEWTADRLECALTAFVTAVQTSKGKVFVSQAMCELCLSAFVRGSGVKRMRQVWATLRELWIEPDEEEVRAVEARLRDLRLKAETGEIAVAFGVGRYNEI